MGLQTIAIQVIDFDYQVGKIQTKDFLVLRFLILGLDSSITIPLSHNHTTMLEKLKKGLANSDFPAMEKVPAPIRVS